jgi:hypothetical protein
MSEIKIGYKILDEMGSIIVGFEQGGILYKINEWIKPNKNCGPLCLFKTFEEAEKYKGWFKRKIYLCEYEPSDDLKVWVDKNYDNNDYNPFCELDCLYKNTKLAKKIKILEEVK